jgi:hypothetical protein
VLVVALRVNETKQNEDKNNILGDIIKIGITKEVKGEIRKQIERRY